MQDGQDSPPCGELSEGRAKADLQHFKNKQKKKVNPSLNSRLLAGSCWAGEEFSLIVESPGKQEGWDSLG